eukprot:5008512-Pyramimonas_sp.AAC.1
MICARYDMSTARHSTTCAIEFFVVDTTDIVLPYVFSSRPLWAPRLAVAFGGPGGGGGARSANNIQSQGMPNACETCLGCARGSFGAGSKHIRNMFGTCLILVLDAFET